MVIGIIRDGIEIRGKCEIKEVVNSGNKTLTVICDNDNARSLDKIIYLCDECGIESDILKRMFFRDGKDKYCLCSKCQLKKVSLEKYGVESPNQSKKIKIKQHKNTNRIDYIDGNELKPNKTSSPEELAKLRSKIMKQRWEDGAFDSFKKEFSKIAKKRWQNDEYRFNVLKAINTESNKKKLSDSSKRMWENESYRQTMSKIGIRISNFQKNVFESMENSWIMEYPIEGTTYTVDMCNPLTKEIVECYGDYWHCNPCELMLR